MPDPEGPAEAGEERRLHRAGPRALLQVNPNHTRAGWGLIWPGLLNTLTSTCIPNLNKEVIPLKYRMSFTHDSKWNCCNPMI